MAAGEKKPTGKKGAIYMKRRYGFALLLAALLACAGCAPQEQEDPAPEEPVQEEVQTPAQGAQASENGEAPEDETPGTDEEARVAVYEGEEITITVPARYADLVYVDDIGSDNIFVVEANLYYVPDYTEDSTPQTCGGWMLTVEALYPDIAAHTADIGPCRAFDGTFVYVEDRPAEGQERVDASRLEEFRAVLASMEVDYGDLEPFTQEDLAAYR